MGVTRKDISTVEELLHEDVNRKLDAEGRGITNIKIDLEDKKSSLSIDALQSLNHSVFKNTAFINTGNTNLTPVIVKEINQFILGLEIVSNVKIELLISKFTKVYYLGRFITIEFSVESSPGVFEKVASFMGASNSHTGIKNHKLTIESTYRDLLKGDIILNWDVLNLDTLYNAITDSTLKSFDFYGVNPAVVRMQMHKVSDSIVLDSAIKKIVFFDKDDFKQYSIKTFSFNENNQLIIEFRTSENTTTFSAITKTLEGVGVQKVQFSSGYILIDVDYLVANNISFSGKNYNVVTEHQDKYTKEISAGLEFTPKLNGEDLFLHDCGKRSDMFYVSLGKKLYKTDIIKDNYLDSDIDSSLFLVTECPDALCEMITDAQELDNGEVIYCANVSHTQGANTTLHGVIYKSDLNGVSTKQFSLSWVYTSHPDSSPTIKGGTLTDVWSFDNYKNVVIISERADQGVGGRVWASNDYGNSWRVIFNPHKSTSAGAYPLMHPSGWDYSELDANYPEKRDFERPVAGTASYPYSYMHVHAVCYDWVHNRIYVTTGDSTWIRGSYTAIWYCDDWNTAPDLAGGTASGSNPIKLKDTTWTRIGLYQDENLLGENLQFTTLKCIGEWILLGSDCGGGNGVNGLFKLKNDSAPTTNSLYSIYQLSADDESLLTHAGSGAVTRDGDFFFFCFHREATNFDPDTQDNKREAYILLSADGVNWRRAWLDDTLDENHNTKITWGMQIYRNSRGVTYLRYTDQKSIDRTLRRLF